MTATRIFDDQFGKIEYRFVRRRYSKTAVFAWLHYRILPDGEWKEYGDPWPKVTPNRFEVLNAMYDIRRRETRLDIGRPI